VIVGVALARTEVTPPNTLVTPLTTGAVRLVTTLIIEDVTPSVAVCVAV
jgi:hypothetical protein